VLAHGVYGSREELAVLAARGTSVAHCPSSNFFLGSGVAGVHAVRAAGVNVGLGCDVGAGTSFSLLGECGDAYKASALAGRPLTSAQLLWLATGGGAAALGLADEIGSFEPGRRADFVVVDPSRDAYLPERLAAATDDADALFALLMLARTHCVAATVVDGVEA
jgi:guanine deaminase